MDDYLRLWSKEETIALLDELRKYPIIYDRSHPFYRIREKRYDALREVVKSLEPIKPGVNPEIIYTKIKVIRTQLLKENHLQKMSSNCKKPKLWCYELCKFLNERGDYTKEIVSSGNPASYDIRIASDEDGNMIKSKQLKQEGVTCMETGEQPRTLKELHTKCLNMVDTLTKEIQSAKVQKATIHIGSLNPTFLALLVESELAEVSNHIFQDAKWKIIHILEEASKKQRDKNRP